MSSTPTGTVTSSNVLIRVARRRARGTPRVGMPSSTVSAAPWVFSRIWWAMRSTTRETSAAARITFTEGCRGGDEWAAGG